MLAGELVAESTRAYRVLETSHPPSWYIPRDDVKMEYFTSTRRSSFCEWKGVATYWTVRAGRAAAEDAAWSYESPTQNFAMLSGCVAFFADVFECSVDGERVIPQPGGFYGGWITRDVVGPFKGIRGSSGW
jgi:uncharacterized protein (DUF427 family)